MDTRVHEHHLTIHYSHRWQDWFRKRYWLRCWTCALKMGPFR